MMTQYLHISGGEVCKIDLEALEARALRIVKPLREGKVETRLPIVFEFSGSPKAGKSSIIGLVSLFLRRAGFRVSSPPEGASIETPPDLKNDLVVFNAWCECYAIQNILTRSHESEPYDVLLLDRGLVDWVVWLEYLNKKSGLIDEQCRSVMASFALQRRWLEREQAVFVFTADPATSLERERNSQLSTKAGRAMNADFLDDLRECYDSVLASHLGLLPPIFRVNTSKVGDVLPSFQRTAYVVADKMLQSIEEAVSPVLMVIDPVVELGVIDAPDVLARIRQITVESARFVPRAEAESSTQMQQVVPYGVLRNTDGKYLCAKRRADERPQLANKTTMLFGGHAEERDFRSGNHEEVFERCLRRELDEELMGFTVISARLIALVNDRSSTMGKKHIAFVHEVQVGGRVAIRRQTADREFGREGPEWKTQDEIVSIIHKLDPWSQLIAARLFGVTSPTDAQSLLFDSK